MNVPVYIYGLFDPRNGELRYIGKTIDLNKRYRSHKCNRDNGHKKRWVSQLKADGIFPEIDVLEISDSANWEEAERFWIAYLKFIGCRLTNSTVGGESPNMTDEIKIKISKAKKGMIIPDHVRAAALIAIRNRVISDVERERKRQQIYKTGIAQKGRFVSEATRLKQRLAKLGKPGLRAGSHLTDAQRRHLSECTKKQFSSSESRMILSSCFGSKHPCYGKHRSDETKQKIRIKALGRKGYHPPLKRSEAEEIYKIANNGVLSSVIMKMFKVSRSTVNDIKSGRRMLDHYK